MNRGFEDNVDKKQKYLSIMKHLSRKREIILLSDFNDFVDADVLKKLLVRSNVHCFQLLSPLDEAKSLPYSLHASSETGFCKFG